MSGWRVTMNLPASIPDSSGNGAKGKEKVGREKAQEEHSKALGCVKVRGTSGLKMDLQKAQVYEREEGCPEKREAEDGLIPPGDQGDDRSDTERNSQLIHVNFLLSLAECAILEI